MTPMLHPELARILEAFKDAPPMDFVNTPITALRRVMDHIPLPAPAVELHAVTELEIPRAADSGASGAIRARLYRATDASDAPIMVYLHGGGWCLGTLDTHDGLCRHLAHLSCMHVCAVDYRLAPEHVFPAALDDAYAAVRWVAEHAQLLHSDAQQLVVAGDSAGGNLAMACSLRAKAQGWGGIRQQLLFYPVCDVRGNTASYQQFGQMPMLTAVNMQQMWKMYHPQQPVHAWASFETSGDWSGLPATGLGTAELDILRDEGQQLGQRLAQAGVPVTHLQAAGMIHGFANFSAVSPAVEEILKQACAALTADCVDS